MTTADGSGSGVANSHKINGGVNNSYSNSLAPVAATNCNEEEGSNNQVRPSDVTDQQVGSNLHAKIQSNDWLFDRSRFFLLVLDIVSGAKWVIP